MPSTGKNPRCSLDDKRELESANNDIILAYVRAGSLYVRYQRERYLDEHLMRAGVSKLYQVGMNNQYRFQFSYEGVGHPDHPFLADVVADLCRRSGIQPEN